MLDLSFFCYFPPNRPAVVQTGLEGTVALKCPTAHNSSPTEEVLHEVVQQVDGERVGGLLSKRVLVWQEVALTHQLKYKARMHNRKM